MKHTISRIGILFFVSLLLFTSCSATARDEANYYTSDAKGSESFDYYADGDMIEMEAADMEMSYTGSSMNTSNPAEAPAKGSAGSSQTNNYGERKIIRNATLSLETKRYDDALTSVNQLVSKYGGYVESSQSYGTSLESSGGERSANYTLRIPAEALDSFIEGIEGRGDIFNVTDKNEYANDITATYYDVEARLNSLLTQEERLLSMLEGATELQYMLQLEQTLADVRYQIESYYSQIKRYDSQVAMSTVNLYLREVIEYQPVVRVQRTYLERLGDAFVDSWEDFVDGLQDFSITIVYMLPGLVIFAVIVLVIVLVIRHAIKKSMKQRQQTMMPPSENKDEENK